ncbi:MAG TPA: hypothetical protein VD886_15635 [Herpetosiphonaceae bacterium]|nr:hypothetical protein [Herpetosiphonaceae bacterium]
MPRNDARLLARITWFAGVVIFGIGLISGRDAMLIFAGLAIAGAVIATAVADR